MFRLLSFPVLAGAIILQAVPTTAAAQDGAFAREFPEAASLLDAADAAHAALIEQLYAGNASASAVEGDTYNRLLSRFDEGDDEAVSIQSVMPEFSRFAPRVAQILERTRNLRRSIYDIYADDGVSNKQAAVSQAVDEYLSQPDVALPAIPKSLVPGPTGTDGSTGISAPSQMTAMGNMEGMDSMDHMNMPGMNMDMDMSAEHNMSMAFQQNFPKTNGLMWAATWLQIGISDPLMFYTNPDQRETGIQTAVAKFKHLLQDAPNNFPTVQPTPPAIAPALLRDAPRAAAILGNLNLLDDLVKDVLVDPQETDKAAAIELVLNHLQDPSQMAVTEYDWILLSLRDGIYFQGGPAIGTLEESERNHSHDMSMPMSTMGN